MNKREKEKMKKLKKLRKSTQKLIDKKYDDRDALVVEETAEYMEIDNGIDSLEDELYEIEEKIVEIELNLSDK
jgi:hypothetical protein